MIDSKLRSAGERRSVGGGSITPCEGGSLALAYLSSRFFLLQYMIALLRCFIAVSLAVWSQTAMVKF